MPIINAPERRTIPIDVAPLEIEERDSGSPLIVGYAAVYNRFSEDLGGFREVIAPGSFRDVIRSADVRALVNHDSNIILGRNKAGTLRMAEDKIGLRVEIDPPSWATNWVESIRRRDITGQSFAFIVGEGNDRWERDENGVVTRTITGFKDLFDVGPVVYPAYPDTSVAARSLDAFLASESRTTQPPDAGRLSKSQVDALMLRLRLAEAG